MSYTLEVNSAVGGQQQLDALTGSTDKLTGSTRGLNDALYGQTAASEKLTLKTAQLSIEETKLEALRERHRIQQDALAAAAAKAAAGQEAFSAGTVKATGSVREMTSALRVLEGGMPIRAAAQFLTTIQGFGPAVSAAFPIIGAIALFGVVEKISDKLGLQINIWHQIEAAQKSSNAQLKSASAEYDGLIQKLKSLQDEEFKRRNGGIAAAGRQSFQSLQAAGTTDRQTIERLEAEIAAVRKVAAIGGPRGPRVLTAEEFQAATLAGVTGIERTSGGSYVASAFGANQQAAKNLLPGLEEALRAAKVQQEVHQAEASDLTAKQDNEIDAKNKEAERKAQEAQRKVEEAQRKADALEARQAAIETKASLAYSAAFFGEEGGPRRRLDTTNARIEAERGKALTEKGVDVDRVNRAFDLEKLAAFMTFLTDGAKDLAKFNDEVEKLGQEGVKLFDHEEGAIAKQIKDYEKNGLGGLPRFGQPDRPEGYVPPEQLLRDARDRGNRAISQIGLRNQLSGAGEGQTIADDYRLRISLAKEENRIQLEIANKKHTEQERQDARDAAEDELHQKRYDADMQRENALLELAVKQKTAFENEAVGLFEAAKSGNVAGFLRGQLNKLEDTFVGNLAKIAYGDPTKGTGLSGLIPHANDPNSTLGKLLQGTPFGADPMKVAGVNLIKAAADLSGAARALSTSRSGGGGSAGGFGVPGIGGGSGPGGYSETDTPTYGLPTDGAGNGDYGGEYGAAVPVPSAGGGLSGLGKGIGISGAAAAGIFGIYSGLHAGGAQGALQAGGSAAAAAGAIASIASASSALGPIGAAVGVGLGLVASILGNPKQDRANEIAGELKYNQYMAPVAIHASMTTGGTYSDFDRFGAPRGSGLSPFPTVEQGFFDYKHDTTVPGRTDSQFGGAGGGTIVVQVHVMDAQSFLDRSAEISAAVQHGLQTGRATGLQETLRHL